MPYTEQESEFQSLGDVLYHLGVCPYVPGSPRIAIFDGNFHNVHVLRNSFNESSHLITEAVNMLPGAKRMRSQKYVHKVAGASLVSLVPDPSTVVSHALIYGSAWSALLDLPMSPQHFLLCIEGS